MRFTLAKAEIKIDAGLERDPPGGQLLGLARPTISSPIHR